MQQLTVTIGKVTLLVLTDKSPTDLSMELLALVDAIARGEEALISVKNHEPSRKKDGMNMQVKDATAPEVDELIHYGWTHAVIDEAGRVRGLFYTKEDAEVFAQALEAKKSE